MKIILNENQLNQLIEAYGQVSNMNIVVDKIILELSRKVKEQLKNLNTNISENEFLFKLDFKNPPLVLQHSYGSHKKSIKTTVPGVSTKLGEEGVIKLDEIYVKLVVIFNEAITGAPIFRDFAINFNTKKVSVPVKRKDKNNNEYNVNVNRYKFDTSGKPIMSVTILTNRSNSPELIHNVLFRNNKEQLHQSTSHELMHYIEMTLQPYVNIDEFSKYQAITTMMSERSGIEILDQLWDILYYLSKIETTVRPTEIKSILKFEGTKKEDFLRVLKNSIIYRNIVIAKNFNWSRFKNDLDNYGKKMYGSNPQKLYEYNNKIKDTLLKFVRTYIKILKKYDHKPDTIPYDTYDPKLINRKRGDKDTFLLRKDNGQLVFDVGTIARFLTNNLNYLGSRAIKKIGRVYASLD